MSRLLFWRRDEPRPASEATRARVAAEERLVEIKAETPEYRALGEALRSLREANHFAAAIRESMGGKP